jgi:predicted small secreted protein
MILMFGRLILVVLAALTLAGCVTASNTLGPDQVAALHLQSTAVSFPFNARIRWRDGERAYAASKGISDFDADEAVKAPAGQAYLHDAVRAKLVRAFEASLKGELTGTRPVRLEIVVKDLEIASAPQRILVGGQHRLTADVTLVDARSGAVVLAFSEQNAIAGAGQGIGGVLLDNVFLGDPIDRVIQNYATQYRNWLLRK